MRNQILPSDGNSGPDTNQGSSIIPEETSITNQDDTECSLTSIIDPIIDREISHKMNRVMNRTQAKWHVNGLKATTYMD